MLTHGSRTAGECPSDTRDNPAQLLGKAGRLRLRSLARRGGEILLTPKPEPTALIWERGKALINHTRFAD